MTAYQKSRKKDFVIDQSDTWKILIVDDEEEIHRLTSIVLDEFKFEGKGLRFLNAFSGKEAMDIIRDNPDVALILLDVVMETDDAGLNVIRYIREDLKNILVQIVLRTGQAGQAPQQEVVTAYDINDYTSKVELTSAKMITTITSSLRAYRLSYSLSKTNEKLQKELCERKKAEEKIFQLTQFQESIIDNADIWLHVTDENNQIAVWNKTAESISGYSRDEVAGRNDIWNQLLRISPSEENSSLSAFTRSSDEMSNVEFPICRKDGEVRTVIWNSRIFSSPSGEKSGMIFLGRDVTEQKMLETQFLQAQKMEAIGRVAGGLAHDFNNLLTVIRGYCELSLLKIDPEDHLHHKIKQIDRAAERAESLTKKVLAFSRHQVMAPKLIHLSQLVGEMEEMISRLITTDVSFKTRLESELAYIEADPGQIEQIIMNLVVNAVDALENSGSICIETRNVELMADDPVRKIDLAEGPYVCLSVIDTGVGMDAETTERIFEPFFTTKEKGKGTGLGLSTVYGIVKQSGGHILVKSDVAKGTRFDIYFPRVEHLIPENEESNGNDGDLIGSETVLVVEDQPEVMQITSETLDLYGYKVLEATNAMEAIALLDEMSNSIDMVLTDIIMPGMNGLQLYEKIHPEYPEIPVLFMSGFTDNIGDNKGIIENGRNFIQKPFTARTLLSFVRNNIDS